MRSLLAVLFLAPAASALLAQTAPAPASTSRPTAALSLQAVAEAALSGNSQIRSEWLRGEIFRGDRVSRDAPFDLQLTSAVRQAQDKKALTSTDFALQQGTTYQVALSRQLRSGVTLSPSVAVTRARFAIPGAPAAGSAEAALSLGVPLMYNRGGSVTAVAQRVADLDFEAVRGGWHTAINSAISAVAGAYWGYLAAIDRLAVQRDAETRAQRLLDETAQLVARDERAPADLQQLRATVASRRSARMLAEQAIEESRVQLGTLMGIEAAAVLTLGAPATPFPVPSAEPLEDSASMVRLAALARERRPDLKAVRIGNQAWDLELQQFRNAQQPRLDLSVNLGYQGFTQGPGFDHLLSPLYHNVPGLNATVQLSYNLVMTNSGALGAVIHEAASVEQQRIALRDVERQVVTDVVVSARAVDRSAAALRESESAVTLYRLSVDNEQRKLKLGMNTLFDVLNAEDALTNALLTAINNRRTYATALIGLRSATGTIADVTEGAGRVDARRLVTVP